MESAIKLENISVCYENVCALKNINLDVKEKEFLAILGPNGGGKSTLLKLILGLKKQSNGYIKIFGKNPKKAKNIIGYVPQFTKFDKKFPISVEEVVLMGKLKNRIQILHRYSQKEKNKAYDIMKKLDIYKFKDRQIGQLSGGQMQRVLIARALLVEPKILLLDEPTASLDTNAKYKIYDLLRELNKNMTIVIVTHDIGVISSYASDMACINKKMYYHGEAKINQDIIEKIYGYSKDDINIREMGGLYD